MRKPNVLMACCIGVALWFPATLAAQAGTIAGRVVTEEGRALGGAQISIVGTGLGGITNAAGRYVVLNVPAGEQTVQASSLGYSQVEGTVTVLAGETASLSFQVGEEAIVLSGVNVTVGSRASHTAADELAVAVDVYPATAIAGTAQVEMAAVLSELSPSVYFPRRQVSDITSGVRPFQLRGMAPDHALVLMNGKRRHATAVVHVFGGGALPGGSGVDMNAIAPFAIGRMEVLRDGAAAQYGSDAIAGVINVGLKNTVSAPSFQLSTGKYFPKDWPHDGQRIDVAGNVGFEIGRGILNLTGAWGDRNRTDRATPDPRDQIVDGDGDEVVDGVVVNKNNPVPQPNHLWGDGASVNRQIFWNYEMPITEDDEGAQLYVFGGYSFRTDTHSGFYRRSLDSRNWPQIHPLGFLPSFDSETKDMSTVAGVRGVAGAWRWDVSGQFGRNRNDNDIFNSLNTSLGPCTDMSCSNAPGESLGPGPDGIPGTGDEIPNATRFYAGSLQLTQYLFNTDVTRELDLGLPSPATFAAGVGIRQDNYQVIAGTPGSYVNGGHISQTGGTAAVGSSVFTGFRPDQEADANRTNVGVYAELEANVTENLLLSTAARFENYSDFGSTLTGKVAARLQATEQVVLRAAAATGFRAPSLSQTYYGHISTSFIDDTLNPGNQVAVEVGEFPVTSDEAKAVGAVPLEEETSRSFSAGIAMTPTNNLNINIDAYLIDVDNAVVLSNSLSGAVVENLLAGFAAQRIRFFSNAIDFRSKGIDVTANYRYYMGQERLFETIFSGNWGQNEARSGVKANPVLEAADPTIANDIFDRADITSLEKGRPKWRGIGKVRYSHGPFRGEFNANYFGSRTVLESESPDRFSELDAGMTFDAEVSYELTEGARFSFGAENLFDKFPDTDPDFFGIFTYNSASPYGFNGRYLYTRLSVALP